MNQSHRPEALDDETTAGRHLAAGAGDERRTTRPDGSRGPRLRAVRRRHCDIVAVRPSVTGHGRVPAG